ncbi:MAG: hypothetical protein LUD68_10155 [Rikenellaceae bacterium]|nr:hypothetical protein [Rikenellaceae bacterium]
MTLKIKFILWALAAAAAFSSCSVKAKDIELVDLYQARMEGISLSQARMTIECSIFNHSGTRLALKSSELEIRDGKGKVLTLQTEKKIILKAHRATEVGLPLVFRFHDPLGTVGASMRLSGNPENLRVHGTIRGSYGLFGKTFTFDDVPLPEFLRKVGLSETDLKKLSM